EGEGEGDGTLRRPMPRPPGPHALTLPDGARLAAPFLAPGPFGRPTPGVWVEVPPGALLRAPAFASVLSAGPLPHRGLALVLELSPGRLLVLTDLDALHVQAGETLRPGDPMAHVGVRAPTRPEFTVEPEASEGAGSPPTFYMEARQGDSAQDPARWFAGLKEASAP
ncbi:MAG: hypothetical protein AAF192_13425, partial [Pseudomonadota bacterium]